MTPSARPWMWWWRLPFALLFVVIGFALPNTPHVFASPFADHGVFMISAGLMIWATYTPSTCLFIRVAAMSAAVLACGGRALVVLFVSSQLTTAQVATGVAVWTFCAATMVFLTLFADRVRKLGG